MSSTIRSSSTQLSVNTNVSRPARPGDMYPTPPQTPNPRLTLDELPGEIFMNIVDHLPSARSISALSQVNKTFHAILHEYLYAYDIQHCGSDILLDAITSGNSALFDHIADLGGKLQPGPHSKRQRDDADRRAGKYPQAEMISNHSTVSLDRIISDIATRAHEPLYALPASATSFSAGWYRSDIDQMDAALDPLHAASRYHTFIMRQSDDYPLSSNSHHRASYRKYHGFSANETVANFLGDACLKYAADCWQEEIFCMIVDRALDPVNLKLDEFPLRLPKDETNPSGMTAFPDPRMTCKCPAPLHYAARGSMPMAVEYLLHLGVDVDARDRGDGSMWNGRTPLMRAMRADREYGAHTPGQSSVEVIKLLVEAGADIFAHTSYWFASVSVKNRTAEHVDPRIRRCAKVGMIRGLQDLGIDVSIQLKRAREDQPELSAQRQDRWFRKEHYDWADDLQIHGRTVSQI